MDGTILAWLAVSIAVFVWGAYKVSPWLMKQLGLKGFRDEPREIGIPSPLPSEFVRKREWNKFSGIITIRETGIEDKEFDGKVEIR
jgi:hypothetical protein